MFNKSLVTIYFLENKILTVEADVKRKQIKKIASQDIPPGIIKDYKVKDIKILSELLKGIWSKFGFNEKTVGIVVPEFSTYSKTLTLPKLSVSELGEAVNWQAQEFLPSGLESMIMDFKIVEKNDDGYEVLMVAIPKDVLMGYVSSCEKAGLFPLEVETPSLSLTNLTKDKEGGSIIIYAGFGETIIVVSDKEKILGTSVLSSTDPKEISETCIKISSHYQKAGINGIYICGNQISESLISELKNSLKKEITLLTAKVKGVDDNKMQEYIIPISMQLGDIKEPSDPRTLNLLPSNLVGKYKVEKTKIQVWSLTLTVTLFTWISFLIVLGSYLVIGQQTSELKNKNLQKAQVAAARAKYQEQAKQINDTADKVLKIKSETNVPQDILNLIQRTKPQGINLVKYQIDFEKGEIVVNGTSPDRNSLIQFQKNLESVPEVSSINIPIGSFENEVNLEFQLSFQYGAKPTAIPQIPKVKVNQ